MPKVTKKPVPVPASTAAVPGVPVTFVLPRALHRRARIVGLSRGVTLKALMVVAVEKYVTQLDGSGTGAA
jgi:hypothetical protein